MPNFFKSFFAGKTENPEEEKQKKTPKRTLRYLNMTAYVPNVWDVRTMPLSALTKRWPLKKISKH